MVDWEIQTKKSDKTETPSNDMSTKNHVSVLNPAEVQPYLLSKPNILRCWHKFN